MARDLCRATRDEEGRKVEGRARRNDEEEPNAGVACEMHLAGLALVYLLADTYAESRGRAFNNRVALGRGGLWVVGPMFHGRIVFSASSNERNGDGRCLPNVVSAVVGN